MSQFKKRLITIIEKSGGIVEDELFVLKPGVIITEVSKSTPEALDLYQAMHCNHGDDYLQSAEFKGRLTYLSFKDQPTTSEESANFHHRMINEAKHLSIYAGTTVTFLIAGCTVETCQELVAHREASVARLTSSATLAMSECLFRVQGESAPRQKEMIREFLQLREKNKEFWDKKNTQTEMLSTEFFNMQNLSCKCNALTFTINIKDLHKLLIGRMCSKGNETEVQEVCSKMAELAHKQFPEIIKEPSFYRKMDDNGEKLAVN
ncbi:hypothetical protein C9374_009201 [Naegleria lovaniensis]|uniref:Uncharacterized protein n=1 Tax=Naegleria lovaniensis TaxID=51637 RepID=A0AA88GIG3_NAELO|nr:uncharacterized protein C9374_009201 [Naegleria lovaniensis]KAG2377685.1 hypothetical protein C9374_009201 [Naegleria lovaniensis]